MKAEHVSNTEISITMTDEEALRLANLLHTVDGTGPHCGTAMRIFFGLREVGIIGGADKEVRGRITCS